MNSRRSDQLGMERWNCFSHGRLMFFVLKMLFLNQQFL